jgi:hypothetical protein
MLTGTKKPFMKNILLLIVFITAFTSSRPQSFYYIEENSPGREYMKQLLLNASQFVSETPITSDFKIKTGVSANNQSTLTVKFSVVDSITFETIFYSEETFKQSRSKNQYSSFTTASNLFFEHNIKNVIAPSKHHTFYKLHQLVKAAKDKTYHQQY